MSILGVITRGCLVVVGMLFTVSLIGGLFVIQALPTAQVDVHGTMLAPSDPPVTMTIRRSESYGLAPNERAAGWEPLNRPFEEQVQLTDSFSVTLPPATYCVTQPIWAGYPPPPIALTLSFSDAPDEEYTLVKSGKQSAYFVRDSAGVDLPAERASWRIEIGELAGKAKGYPSLWSLELEVERQQPPPQEDAGPATS